MCPLADEVSLKFDQGTEDVEGVQATPSRRSMLRPTGVRACAEAMKNFERITVDPAQMGGVPCVRHVRIPVATVLRLLAAGATEREILSEYPDLQIEDIRECLRFAAVRPWSGN